MRLKRPALLHIHSFHVVRTFRRNTDPHARSSSEPSESVNFGVAGETGFAPVHSAVAVMEWSPMEINPEVRLPVGGALTWPASRCVRCHVLFFPPEITM